MLTFIQLKRTLSHQITNISVMRVWNDWTVTAAYSFRILYDGAKCGIPIRDALSQLNGLLKNGDTFVFFSSSDKKDFFNLAKYDINLRIAKRSKVIPESEKNVFDDIGKYIAYQAKRGILTHDYLKKLIQKTS